MKKIAGMVVLCGVFLLAGCRHEHVWEEATCETPKRCVECGDTEGNPRKHLWKGSDCTSPKKCELCGATEGEPLGHNFLSATCIRPEECGVCGERRGEIAAHTGEMIGRCDLCDTDQNKDLVLTLGYRQEVVTNYYLTVINEATQSLSKEMEVMNSLPETEEEGRNVTIGEYSFETMTIGNFFDWMNSLVWKNLWEEHVESYEEMRRVCEEVYLLCADYPELASLKEKTKEVIDAIPLAMPEKEKKTGDLYDYKMMDVFTLGEEEKASVGAMKDQWMQETEAEMKADLQVFADLATEIDLWAEEYNKVTALFE